MSESNDLWFGLIIGAVLGGLLVHFLQVVMLIPFVGGVVTGAFILGEEKTKGE